MNSIEIKNLSLNFGDVKVLKDLNLSETEYNRVVKQALDEKKKNGNQILAKVYLGNVIETLPSIQTYLFFLKDEKAYQNWLKPKKGFENSFCS